ncbi:MAG: VOC family protein [Thermomicrobiales bacterium]
MTNTNASHKTPPAPVFTQVRQIGIVVRDLETAIWHYSNDYGIGPWQRHERLTPENAADVRIHGQPAPLWNVAAASAMVGDVMWELIEPRDEKSIFADFLAKTGGGVHHLAVTTPNFDAAVAASEQGGEALALSGTFSGIRVAYLPTDRDLGVILEIFAEVARQPIGAGRGLAVCTGTAGIAQTRRARSQGGAPRYWKRTGHPTSHLTPRNG